MNNVDELLARAAYYRWCAARAHRLPGNDPITGLPRDHFFSRAAEGESVAAYKAMARFNIEQARKVRISLNTERR